MTSVLQIGDRGLSLTVDGRLGDMNAWSKQAAVVLASNAGINLNHDHWLVIDFIRDYFKQFNISPLMKLLVRWLAQQRSDNQFSANYIGQLFNDPTLNTATKISGVPVTILDAEREFVPGSEQNKGSSQHFINHFVFEGAKILVTDMGNLIDLHLWNKKLAFFMAEKEGIVLVKDHWEVINYLRKFYFDYGLTPMVKILMKHMKEELGAQKSSEEYLYKLFPKGPSRQGSRIAGLHEPQGCIDP